MKCFTASPWTIPRTPLGEITTCYWETLIIAVTEKLCSPHRADIMPHWPQKQFRFRTHHETMFVWPGSTDPSNEPSELERAFWYNYRKCIDRSLWAVGSRTCPVWEDFSFICAFPTLVFVSVQEKHLQDIQCIYKLFVLLSWNITALLLNSHQY